MKRKHASVFVPMLAVLALSLVSCQSDSFGETVDILIVNGTVVTMDSNRIVLDEGAVAIDDGVIVAVGTSADLTSEFKGTLMVEMKVDTAMTVFDRRTYLIDLTANEKAGKVPDGMLFLK